MAKIAVNIVTGFLGSGKTTFLSELLRDSRENIAVLVNEFGDSGLDDSILASFFVEEQTILLNQGCICCNRRQDLADKLKEILNLYHTSGKKLDKVVIETTGLATIEPILFTILSDTFLQNHFFVNAVFTCIDSLNGLEHLKNEENIAQIVNSDYLLITKTDIKQDTKMLEKELRSLNYSALIFNKNEFCNDEFFNINFKKRLVNNPKDLNSHNTNIKTISLNIQGKMDWSAFGIWLSALLYKYGDKILRVKGLLNINDEYLINVNGVRHLVYPPIHIKKTKTYMESNLVFISKEMDLDKVFSSLQSFSKLLNIQIQTC